MPEQLRVIVAGGIGAMPFAGVTWQVMHYLEGFRRLGHEVFYLEDTQRWPYDPVRATVSDHAGPAIAYVSEMVTRCGLSNAWAYRDVARQDTLHGTSERELERALAAADVLVNVSGVMVLREEHLQVPARVYLETDPVLPQIEINQGNQRTIDILEAHSHHFTYGENFGAPDCTVPLERFRYQPTRPPVIVEWWRRPGAPALDGRPFTTIANWHQTSKDVVWNGRKLTWSKDMQFIRLLSLPSRAPVPIELALTSLDERTSTVLLGAGWHVRSADPLSKNVDAYRHYIRCSAGEFSVAKEQYALLRSGWFSDRTVCYLAAGLPAIVQDTGFGRALPTGEGLLPFSTLEEAVAAFETVTSEYQRHAAAARAIAEECFRAERVLGDLLEAL
jgi:hypothetical protein